jgi:asparagine synthase (glutamine-hydrolysing)
MCEKIKKETDIKVLLSGEGSDEIFGGYIYSHKAPSPNDLFKDSCRLLTNIHEFDGLRADRCVGSWGLELRVPFLDKNFVRYVMEIVPEFKMSSNKIEKKILRDTFRKYIPYSVYLRPKNGMSDAVGKNWIDYIKNECNDKLSDKDYEKIQASSHHLTPISKEEAWYRAIYSKHFPETCYWQSGIWRPQWSSELDPSARLLSCFQE